ncbi:MAG: hypothetical protein K0S32_703 [Bacteroidetes bacterium]|jgi:hypothetical protein|nr:hypothetical protein [Bacteroidota bacterium]
MANNPVSGTDPDGGWVSASRDLKGQQFAHKAAMDRDRQSGNGDYSNDAVQKRYNEEYENLRIHFLGNEYGRRGDIKGYLEAIQAVNSHYAGLTKSFGSGLFLSYQSGIDYLTSNEMVLNSNTFGETTDQAKGLSANSSLKESMLATDNSGNGSSSLAKFVESKKQFQARTTLQTINKIMQNGEDTGLREVTQYNPDGSEVRTTFDINGAVTGGDGVLNIPIVSLSFRSAEYAEGLRSKLEGTTFYNGKLLTNNSENTIYWKPDVKTSTHSDWGAYPLLPGQTSDIAADALNVQNKVYKLNNNYKSANVDINNKISVRRYNTWFTVSEKDRGFMLSEMFEDDGRWKKVEYPLGSGNYYLNTQWWNIFNPQNQIPDLRK